MVTATQKNVLNIDVEKVVEILRDNKGKGYNALLVEFEKVMLEETLVMTRGNQTRAAEVLGLNRGTLRKKISYLSSR
ncbi:helix-turn-helix domain-containing protein [Acinetobacter bohemicus]|uniref:helix-turn-helix domain-containing protein n=1 Tax=Acinetobacter bohemicus TaxID=1435036 RepID=UPI00192B78EA|nr:helix-turn-helix domain-containing protein [Acinetobacter bohemicus]CAD9194540.1 hypothetical protein QAC21B_00630 [Acinetobacter bohemicus]